MTRPYIILGAGGHGRVVADVLLSGNHRILGCTDPRPEKLAGIGFADISFLGDDQKIDSYDPSEIFLANGLGGIKSTSGRQKLYDRFVSRGYLFPSIRHLSTVISPRTELEDGSQFMAGSVVQANCRIGANVIVNTGARIDHDCTIAAHVHIGPGAILCGEVTIEAGVTIGAGATLRPGLRVGSGATIGMGAVVLSDVMEGSTVVGVPARPRESNR